MMEFLYSAFAYLAGLTSTYTTELISAVACLLIGIVLGLYFSGDLKNLKWGILARWQSWWIGAHWSDYNKRLCVNVVPLITVWIAASDGKVPEQGFDIYRSDADERGSFS